MPLPINLGSIGQVFVDLDCIRCNGPADGSNAVVTDEQRYEPAIYDAKLLYAANVFPFRMIFATLDGWAYLRDTIGDRWESIPRFGFNLNPTLPGVGWGGAAVLDQQSSPDGSFSLDPFFDSFWQDLVWGNPTTFASPAHFWLYSCALDNLLHAAGSGSVEVQVMQFLATQAVNYEIWKVTMRAPLSIQGDYTDETGDQPPTWPPIRSQTPWGSSSDFAFVSSGSLVPGQVLTIPPHDLAPRSNAQRPPAAQPSGSDGDWAGWGVCNFLIFV